MTTQGQETLLDRTHAEAIARDIRLGKRPAPVVQLVKREPDPQPDPEPEPRDFMFNGFSEDDDEAARPSVRQIIAGVEARHGLPKGSIIGYRRSQAHIAARYEAIGIVADLYPELSITRIGHLFRRDHTTILYALGKRNQMAREAVRA